MDRIVNNGGVVNLGEMVMTGCVVGQGATVTEATDSDEEE